MGWLLSRALLYVALAALKRYTGGTAKQRGTLLDVLDSKTLAPNRSVYVIRAGDKRLVLGVTQNQITQDNRFQEATNRQASTSGVNLDEELVNLTTYQQAYSASARLLSVVDQLYETLLQISH